MDVMGSHVVVLSSSEAATDLLERRSALYRDKVRRPFDIQFTPSVLTNTDC